MIAPALIPQLVGGTRLAVTRDAIRTALAALLPGVTVVAHPGKVDINDFVAKAIVQAPGVAVGYTRLRQAADVAGTWSDLVDFACYIVVDDYVDSTAQPPRVIGRELVGHAIGAQILGALRDPDLPYWGLTSVEPPATDPAPALTPVFTMKVEANMTAVYAVTWTQALANDGAPMFGGPPMAAATADDFPDHADLVFDLGDEPYDALPPELQAHIRRPGP